MSRLRAAAALLGLSLLAACGSPDTKALKTLACQQVASSIDLQSAQQIDTLRKALGLAPGVDPIGACRALGVNMDPQGAAPGGEAGAAGRSGEGGEGKAEAEAGNRRQAE
ncbi:MAG: hypothetical protein VKK62_03765 [Synechococcaceae cyanobacterium]|nr:hypothetical protein [Synechococcaceae cyanobacterium]